MVNPQVHEVLTTIHVTGAPSGLFGPRQALSSYSLSTYVWVVVAKKISSPSYLTLKEARYCVKVPPDLEASRTVHMGICRGFPTSHVSTRHHNHSHLLILTICIKEDSVRHLIQAVSLCRRYGIKSRGPIGLEWASYCLVADASCVKMTAGAMDTHAKCSLMCSCFCEAGGLA